MWKLSPDWPLPSGGGARAGLMRMEVIVDVKLHAYGDLKVLEDVKLHLHSGEIVSVIGPSGCGKSTLLGIMGGILKATDGKVYMEGAVPADSLNPLTYIFQDF